MPGAHKIAALTLERPPSWQPASPTSRPSPSSSSSRNGILPNGPAHTPTKKRSQQNKEASATPSVNGPSPAKASEAGLSSQMAMEALLAKYLKEPLQWETSQLPPTSVKYPPINPSEDHSHRPIAGPSRLNLTTPVSSGHRSIVRGLKTSSPLSSPSPLRPRAPSVSDNAGSNKNDNLAHDRIPLHFPGGLRRTGAGLSNRGNTCYMNSTMQALLHTPPLAHLLLTRDVDQIKGRYGGTVKGFDPVKALQSLTERALKGSGSVTVPLEFIKNIRAVARSFHPGRQEDAHEWLRLLMESVQQVCLASASADLKKSALKETTFIQKIFGGKLLSRVTCLSCLHNSDTFDPILDLSLDIRGCENLAQAMSNFTQIDELRGSEKYKCEKCKKLVVARKQFTLEKCPEVLTVHLKRFTFNGSKMSRAVAFPEKLKISPSWTSSKQPGPAYTLYAVVHHHGGGPHSGHYVAEVKSPSGVWCEMNDDFVSQQRQGPGGASSKSAYILFYVKDARSQLDGVVNGNVNGKAMHTSPRERESSSARARAHSPPLSKKAKSHNSDEGYVASAPLRASPLLSSSPNTSTSRFSAANGPQTNGKHEGIGEQIFGSKSKKLPSGSRLLNQPVDPMTFHASAGGDVTLGASSSNGTPMEEDIGETTTLSSSAVQNDVLDDGSDNDDDDGPNEPQAKTAGSSRPLEAPLLSKKQRRKLERRQRAVLRRSLLSGASSKGTADQHAAPSGSAPASAFSSSPLGAASTPTSSTTASGKLSSRDKLKALTSPYAQSIPMPGIFRNYVPSTTSTGAAAPGGGVAFGTALERKAQATDAAVDSNSLPESLIAATLRPRALDYLTRGLTSQIYSFDLDKWQRSSERQRQEVEELLHQNDALSGSSRLVVKSVDLDEQARPHDVLLEIDILKRIQTVSDERRKFVISLLHHEEELPDDFTTIQRLYLPRYPTSLAAFFVEDAASSATDRCGFSQSQRVRLCYSLAHQLFSALDFLHTNHVYHRDIKPSNLLLTSTPRREAPTSFIIKLCDFGTAFASAEGNNRPKTSSTSTHPYTPPELLFSPTGGYDGAAVDIWEAACVIAEALGEAQVEQEGLEPESQSPPFASDGFPMDDSDANSADAEMERSLERHCLWPSSGRSELSEADDSDEISKQPRFSKRGNRMGKKQYRRQTLFKGQQGDIGLAADIFTFLGLPEGDREDLWPEAVHFHPPLSRLPFPRAEAPAMPQTLQDRLPILARAVQLTAPEEEESSVECDEGQEDGEGQGAAQASAYAQAQAQALQDLLLASLKLSAGQRWSARQVVDRLSGASPGAIR